MHIQQSQKLRFKVSLHSMDIIFSNLLYNSELKTIVLNHSWFKLDRASISTYRKHLSRNRAWKHFSSFNILQFAAIRLKAVHSMHQAHSYKLYSCIPELICSDISNFLLSVCVPLNNHSTSTSYAVFHN